MKQNRPLISVIVPIYNVEQYLVQCLESIESQTYDKFECILIVESQIISETISTNQTATLAVR